MKRITWFLSFSFACVLGAACAEEPSVICDVVWSANGMEVGSGTITYDNLENVDAAVDMCLEDQADHEDRPAEATNYECNCATD